MALPALLQGNLRLPLIGAPMFIVSRPALVIAQCTAGIVGSFPALNARPQSLLDDWIKEIKDGIEQYRENNPEAPVAPFAVNQIVHMSNSRLYADMETCVKHEVPIIITSLRPPDDVVKAVHAYGGLVFHDVISLRHARKAMEQNVDGIIAVCAGAGGHAGTLSPFALIKEIRREFDGALILSGCMSTGADILAYAVDDYKNMIVDSNAVDIVYSSYFSGVAGNYLKNSVQNAGFDPDNLPEGDLSTMDFAKREENEVKAWRDIWSAGQGSGSVSDVLPAAELVMRMETEYEEARSRLAG
jgi:nitronate monooxygenase